MTSSHYCYIISLLLKQEDFLKYYINNKYKQLNIRTMAESFEGKKISNPLANLRPQKMQYGAKIGGFGKVNRQRFSQHCKGSDAMACIRTRIKPVISRISCKNAHRQCVVQWFDSQQKLLIIW
jgi:hypothetical protein